MKPAYSITPCVEKWSRMPENPDGTRHCATCKKNLVDFRNMSWREITRLQKANNNSLCGTYRRSQFNHASTRFKSFFSSGWITATSLLLWLTTPKESSASGNGATCITLPVIQPQDSLSPQKKKTIVIHGMVSVRREAGDTSAVQTIHGADIVLKGTSLYMTTDSLGMFEMDISDYRFASGKQPVLIISHPLYETLEVTVIRDYLFFNELVNIQLQSALPVNYDNEEVSGGIGEYYEEPSWFDRLCKSLGW